MIQTLHLLSGTWHNQLGSVLVLEEDGSGALRGRYRAAAGSAPDRSYAVAGSYDPEPFGPVTVLGFVVDWAENHSVTVWSGQYHRESDQIRATWLLTTETSGTDDWKSTVIGHDVFRRGPA